MGQDIDQPLYCPVRLAAQRQPDSVALSDNQQTLTYAQLDRAVESTVASLAKAGIKPGNTVALLSRNSFAYAVLFFAALRWGCRLLLLNCRMRASDWGEQISKANADLLVNGREFTDDLASLDVGRAVMEDFLPISHSVSTMRENKEHILGRDALIIYTSGSSGHPRGVVLSWGNLYFSALGCIETLALDEDDIWLAVLPFFHVGGISILFRTALAGCAAYLMEEFDADEIISLCHSQPATIISVVPTMLAGLLEKDRQNHLRRSKAIIVGGAALDGSLRDEVIRRGWPVFTSYGLTETGSMVTLLGRKDPPDRLSTVGKVLPYRELAVVDEAGRTMSDGQAGRIKVRGATRFDRYLHQNDSPFDDDGWFETGDRGWLDEKGYLTVTGRTDRIIVSGGENIDLDHVEQFVKSVVGVKGAVVIARRDGKWGQRPVAFVEVQDEKTSKDTVMAVLRKRLPAFMLPDRLIIVSALPQTASGKYDRLAVARQHRDIIERED